MSVNSAVKRFLFGIYTGLTLGQIWIADPANLGTLLKPLAGFLVIGVFAILMEVIHLRYPTEAS